MSDVSDGEIVPTNPGNRTKAARIRRKVAAGDQATPEEIAWLDEYEQAQRKTGSSSRAASRSSKLVHIEESNESAAESHGEGTTAYVAASAAMVREEGRRLDFLASAGLNAMNMAFGRVLEMNKQLLERNEALETAHVDLMNAVTKGHLDLTAAEIENMRTQHEAEQAGDQGGVNGMVQQLLPALLQEMTARLGPRANQTPKK
jgi:hypothetical protein